ncbi:hypothetical protein ES708_34722 [subsurface metagenome]
MVEWVTTKNMDEVEDGKVEVIGPELADITPGSRLPMAITVEVAGREMQDDFEPSCLPNSLSAFSPISTAISLLLRSPILMPQSRATCSNFCSSFSS